MRILHIGKFYPPFAGGMEYFLADLLVALQDEDVSVAALVHHHPFTLRGQPPTSTPAIYRAPCYGRLVYVPISPAFPFWLARALREFKPDLLHFHLPNTSAFWALWLPAARRLPWIVHWQSDIVRSHLDRRLAIAYRFYRPLEQAFLARCQAIIATSPPYLDASEALRPWREKCHIIPLGIDPRRIADPIPEHRRRAELRWAADGALKVLCVGRLTYYKGHDVLLHALARMPAARLLIVGEGELRRRLETLIKTLHLENRVTLMGFLPEPELYALVATCDVFCLPSLERTESFGLVMLEAMRFQKPLIASDIAGSGVGWVIGQGGQGLLVPPHDPDALAAALRQLRENPEQRAKLGHAGERCLNREFHISPVARRVKSLYEEAIADAPKPPRASG